MGRADAWPGRLGLGGATPILFGFANFVLPLQIGAPDVAFPRLNALSYWLFLFGGVITVSGFLTPGGAADFGWFAYTPLSSAIYSPGAGGDLWIAGLTVSGLGTILGAVNMVTTIVCLRAPGMTMFRMPIFTWNVLVTSVMTLIAFPILTAALLGLAADRHLGAHVFDPANGGVILWQHLSQPNSVQSLVTSLDRFRAGPHRVLAGAVAGPQARPSSSPGGCSNRRCRIPGQHRVHGGGDSEDTALTTSNTALSSVTSRSRPWARVGARTSNRARSSSLRTVPTTVWPAASARCAKARPKPLLAPVISKVRVGVTSSGPSIPGMAANCRRDRTRRCARRRCAGRRPATAGTTRAR